MSTTPRINPNPTVAASGAGALVAFLWNWQVPSYPMDAVVAAAAAPLLGHVIRWAVSWLPEPSKE